MEQVNRRKLRAQLGTRVTRRAGTKARGSKSKRPRQRLHELIYTASR